MDVSALLGGAIIGLAASLLWVFNGRIAGVSGMISRLPERTDSGPAFLGGLLTVGLVLGLTTGAPQANDPNIGLALSSGALVGLGTFLANGCTSGHGVCGIARLSKRSVVSTLIFMGAAGVTVFLRGLL
ncbi:MAG: YeeE/YedE family protein [bacterium]